jgi:pimeloyl-ACP methyl ester carboxylesterase
MKSSTRSHDAITDRRSRRRRLPGRRLLVGGTAALVVLVLAFFAGGGWVYAGEIRAGALDPKPPGQPKRQLAVLAVDGGSISLARDPSAPRELTQPGVWGLQWAGGYGHLGAVTEVDDRRVVRGFTRLQGTPPRVGERVALDGDAYGSDPGAVLGLPYRQVTYRSPVGSTPAWLVPGSRDTWVLFVHGYNAPLREALRTLGPVAHAGFPALVLAYRNDPGAPGNPDGLRHWGQAEWRDLEGAVDYAVDHGAGEVVLVGYSMGGAVVASFLYRSPLAAKVAGVILDSPGLDLDAVIDHGAKDRKLPALGLPVPTALTAAAEGIAGLRYQVDWDTLDYVARSEQLAAPILLFHQRGDPRVPFTISEELAAARPDLVTFERFDGAGHVKAWNQDPARYERAVRGFLDRVAPPARDRPQR